MTILSIFAVTSIQVAHGGTTSNCGSNASPHPDFATQGYSCNAICAENGNTWGCNTAALACDSEAWIIHNPAFAPSVDVVAWGRCVGGGSEFCCQWDEGASMVTKVKLNGSNNDDVLSLTYDTYDLSPWNLNLEGIVEAKDGDDQIFGSNFNGTAYTDKLFGLAGIDTIAGGDGEDLIFGGIGNDILFGDEMDDSIEGEDGDDDLFGGTGDDTLLGGIGADDILGEDGNDVLDGSSGDDKLTGGEGDDALDGGENNDVLCDNSGLTMATCATDLVQVLLGGVGDDALWYNKEAACMFSRMNAAASSGGAGADTCGDSVDWGALPGSCMATNMAPACL